MDSSYKRYKTLVFPDNDSPEIKEYLFFSVKKSSLVNSFFSLFPSIVEKSKEGLTKISDSFIHSFPEFCSI